MTDTFTMDRKVTFKRGTVSESSRGSMNDAGLASIGSGWAKVNYGRSDERRRAGIEASEISATLRVRASTVAKALTAADFVELDAHNWNISNAVPYGRWFIDITATRRG